METLLEIYEAKSDGILLCSLDSEVPQEFSHPVKVAVWRGHDETARFLLNYGADPTMGMRINEARMFVREHNSEGSQLTCRLHEALYNYKETSWRFPESR